MPDVGLDIVAAAAGLEGVATYIVENVDCGDAVLNVAVLFRTSTRLLASVGNVDGGGGISNVPVLSGTWGAVLLLLLKSPALHVAETAELVSAAAVLVVPVPDRTSESVSRTEVGRLVQTLLAPFQIVPFQVVPFI